MKNRACSRLATMPWLLVFALVSAIAFAPVLLCQSQNAAKPATAPVSYANEALIIERSETTYKYNEDGTGEKYTVVRMKVQNEAGARQFSVLSLPFASATESPKLESLVVHHPDGTSTETPAADAMEMPAPVTQQAPFYSDLKMLQIPVRSLRAGDVLEYSVRVQRKNPEAPSQFWDNYQFAKEFVVLSEKLSLDIPASKYVQQWSPTLKPTITENAGHRVFTWTSSQLTPTPPGEKKDGESQEAAKPVKPDVAWTTFHSWAEVGDWYRSVAISRSAPTDAIRAQADEITRQAATPEAQVQALYAFVSTHVRYIGIDFGVGRYQPHAAAEVLANQYGDCKDKDTLFEALLHAKGFTSAPALIGVGLEMVSEVPSPAFFNHVITTVNMPSGKVWLDTTPGVAPFRLLVEPIRDKPALVIPPTGVAAIEKTPADTPFPFVDRFEAVARLTKDGELSGQVNIIDHSDSEILIRALALGLAPAQWDRAAQFLANTLGFSGTTTNSRFEHPEDIGQPIHLTYDYGKKPFGDWGNFRIVPLFPLNSLPAAPTKEPDSDIELGSLRTENVLSRIHLPEGFGVDLPDAVHVKTPFATFDLTYKFENGDFIAQRDLVVLRGKLPAKSWQDYKKFAEDISSNQLTWVQLTAKASVGAGAQPPRPGQNNPQAATLVSEANDLEKKRDYTTALQKLDEARKLNPEQPWLWSNYGYVAMVQNRPDDAKTAYRRELANYPDEGYVVQLFANFLLRRSETAEAREVLKASFDRDQTDTTVALMLAAQQSTDSLDESIATLRKADKAKPETTAILSTLATYLIRNHQKPQAAEVAAKMLAGAGDDPNRLNDGAYSLAEADGDLAEAEKDSRKSIDIVENQTAIAAVSEANQQSFNRTSLLVASWDTLGYILLRQKKNDEAVDYLEAAWKSRPDPTVGLHYGEALEAAGKPAEAARIYDLAASQVHGKTAGNPDAQSLQDNIGRLKAAGVKWDTKSSIPQSLQEDRTFKIAMTSACTSYASSTYRLQIASSGPPEILRVGGEAVPDAVLDSIKKLSLSHLVPTASKAKILRDAVFSCSAGKSEGYVVLMPLGGMDAEHVGN